MKNGSLILLTVLLALLTAGAALAETEFPQGFALTLPQDYQTMKLSEEDRKAGFLLRAVSAEDKLTLAIQWQRLKRGGGNTHERVRSMSQTDKHVTVQDMDGIPSDFIYCVEKHEGGPQEAAFTLALFSASKNGHVLNCWFLATERGTEDVPLRVMQSFRWIEDKGGEGHEKSAVHRRDGNDFSGHYQTLCGAGLGAVCAQPRQSPAAAGREGANCGRERRASGAWADGGHAL